MEYEMLRREKWWPRNDEDDSSESTAIIAGCNIPSGVLSLPFLSCFNLKKSLKNQPVQSVFQVSFYDKKCIFIYSFLGID